MAKKIDGYIKLQIQLVKQIHLLEVGPALGQKVNIMEFAKLLMHLPKKWMRMPIPVVITVM